VAARLASDVLDVPTILLARTDANAAKLLTSDVDEPDHKFLTGGRTKEGFFEIKNGISSAIARGIAYAPYADLIWCETARPDLGEAKQFAEAMHKEFPNKLLSYNCSPSFNWSKNLDEKTIAKFQTELGAMGYKFQFVTLAGFHTLNLGMFELAHNYKTKGMAAYAKFQNKEFEFDKEKGYMATTNQHFVGAGYFDKVAQTISGEDISTGAMGGSTEQEQF